LVNMSGFSLEPDSLKSDMAAACAKVIYSNWYVLGPEVREFEAAWAARCGTGYAVGVGNGLDAIEIGLRCLGVGPGDEVITTSMSAFATLLGILRCGAVPVLADIDPATGLLSIESVERCLTPKTRVVLLVHLYGQVRKMAAWRELCERHGVDLMEDCAQAHLAEIDGRVAGDFGRVGAYSFYPTKNLGAVGDGGAVVTSDADLAMMAQKLRNYGESTRYHHAFLGLNSRLDELQAAVLLARIEYLDAFTERRREIAGTLMREIDQPRVKLLAAPEASKAHSYHLFVLLSKERDELAMFLKDRGIETLIHYPVPLHRQPAAKAIRCDPHGLPNAEEHAQTCLSIPCHPQLSEADVDAIVSAVNGFRK
jgi:dTDP-4-amino-4,6-dideoxygalactose transaminase